MTPFLSRTTALSTAVLLCLTMDFSIQPSFADGCACCGSRFHNDCRVCQGLRARSAGGCADCGRFGCRGCGGWGCRPGKVPSYWAALNGTCPNCVPRQYANPDLFYNFYANTNCGGATAGMYPCPYPAPEQVGHTYYTYQPFMPHEFLYPHERTYHSYYDGGRGLTRTKADWSIAPGYAIKQHLKYMFEIPR